jgi:hypothetical protein
VAHRTDARDQIVHGLARVRRSSAGWGWLVVDALDPYPPAEIVGYVQFTSYPGPGLRAEAMGNAHLPPDRHLDGEAQARIRELGWREGSEEESSGNWVASVRGGTRGNREANAELALTTLEVVFGCGPGTRYRVTTEVWFPAQAATDGPSPYGPAGSDIPER